MVKHERQLTSGHLETLRVLLQIGYFNQIFEENLYVAGSLAGWRSQFAICAGSGAQVATDILTLWNDGKHAQVHDKL